MIVFKKIKKKNKEWVLFISNRAICDREGKVSMSRLWHLRLNHLLWVQPIRRRNLWRNSELDWLMAKRAGRKQKSPHPPKKPQPINVFYFWISTNCSLVKCNSLQFTPTLEQLLSLNGMSCSTTRRTTELSCQNTSALLRRREGDFYNPPDTNFNNCWSKHSQPEYDGTLLLETLNVRLSSSNKRKESVSGSFCSRNCSASTSISWICVLKRTHTNSFSNSSSFTSDSSWALQKKGG